MKNVPKSNPAKHNHTVVVCYLISKKSDMDKIIVMPHIDFKVRDTVWFIPEGTNRITEGKVVRIQADIGTTIERKKQFVTYTIEYGEKKHLDVPYSDVYATLEQLFEAYDLHEFDCEISIDHCSTLRETAIAKTLDDAIAYLKAKYPWARDVYEADPLR